MEYVVDFGLVRKSEFICNLTNTLCDFMSKYSESVNSLLEGKNEGISTSELSGGARIHYIFQSIIVKCLEEVDPCVDLTDDYIRTAIQNSTGPRSALFVPEVPFEVVVRKQISRLLEPSLQCTRFIYDELVEISRRCMVSDLQRFPVMRKRVDEVVDTSLMSMYGELDCLNAAWKVFDEMTERDVGESEQLGYDPNSEEIVYQQNPTPAHDKSSRVSLEPIQVSSVLELLQSPGTIHTESSEQLRCTDGKLSNESSEPVQSSAALGDDGKLDSTQESPRKPEIKGMAIEMSTEQEACLHAQSVMLDISPQSADESKGPEKMATDASVEVSKGTTTATLSCVETQENTKQEEGSENTNLCEQIAAVRVFECSKSQEEGFVEPLEFKMLGDIKGTELCGPFEEGSIEQKRPEGNDVDQLESEIILMEIYEQATVTCATIELSHQHADKGTQITTNKETEQVEMTSASVGNPTLMGLQENLEAIQQQDSDQPEAFEQVMLGLPEGLAIIQEIGELPGPSEAELPGSSELVGTRETDKQLVVTEEDAVKTEITKESAEQIDPLVSTNLESLQMTRAESQYQIKLKQAHGKT